MPKLDNILPHTNRQEQALLQAVIKAGDALMDFWPGKTKTAKTKDQESLNIQEKSDGTFVTDADFKSNEILLKALQEIYPEDQICSEEVGYVDQTGEENDQVWFVDPLDGTSNFIDGEDDFLVLLGLCKRGKPILGIAYLPARDRLVFAAEGRGAYCSQQGKLHVGTQKELKPEEVSIRKFKLGEEYTQLGFHSGTAQLKVSCGELSACAIKLTDSHCPKSWDFAAFQVIVTESGGIVSDHWGNEIKYESDSLKEDFYIASNKQVHKELIDLIYEHLKND